MRAGLASLLPRFGMGLVVLAGGTTQCGRTAPVREVSPPVSISAVVYFDRHDAWLPADAIAALRPIGTMAKSNPLARILILGFANEEPNLHANLDLAERRAQSVARQLAAWSITNLEIIIAAAEAAPNDEQGARCDVTLVSGSATSQVLASVEGNEP